MIKAGALFYTIVISLIITIICSSFILYSYITSIQIEKNQLLYKLRSNVYSAITLALYNEPGKYDQGVYLDLFNNNDSVFIRTKTWGAYEVILTNAFHGPKYESRVALVGFLKDSANSFSLYIKDNGKPLSVSGNTILKGDVYISKAGIKNAYIEGSSFVGDRYVDGNIKWSNPDRFEINDLLVKRVKPIVEKAEFSIDDSVVSISMLNPEDSIFNNFYNKTLVLKSNSVLEIRGGQYFGNIAIVSLKKVIIHSEAKLEDVLIFAPKINVNEGFDGTVQLFSTDSIHIEKDVKLNYPSSVFLIKGKTSCPQTVISFSPNDTIIGNVMAINDNRNDSGSCGVYLNKDSFVFGDIFSNDITDLKGTVLGTVKTERLVLTTSSAVYENHLLNATVDVTKLPKNFVGNSWVKSSNERGVAKWLK